MNTAKLDLYKLSGLLVSALILFMVSGYLGLSEGVLVGIYVLLIAIIAFPLFSLSAKWWVPLILGLVILLPGPMDRMFLSVNLTPEKGVNPYGIFSVIDLLMLTAIVIRLKSEGKLYNLFNFKLNYLTVSLIIIFFFNGLSSFLSYINYQEFHFPMAFRASFYFIRFMLVFAWIDLFFEDFSAVKKMHVALFLITLGFVLLALLSPRENYEGGNRLSVATYGVNTFGHLLAFFSLFSVPFLMHFRKTSQKLMLLTGICFGICFLFLMISANRMSFLLLVFGFGLFFLLYPMTFRKKLRLGIVIFLILVTTISVFAAIQPDLYNRIFGLFNIVSGENALESISELQARFVVWSISLEMVNTHPLLGIGPGQWNYLKYDFGSMPPWMTTILDPHNGYLLYSSEAGLISTFIYYSILFVSVRNGFKAYKRLKRMYLENRSVDTGFYMSFILMLAIIVICWMISDLSNASGLNIRVQSLMWSLCSILFISPTLVKKLLRENHES
jgi:O-antigen ligase